MAKDTLQTEITDAIDLYDKLVKKEKTKIIKLENNLASAKRNLTVLEDTLTALYRKGSEPTK